METWVDGKWKSTTHLLPIMFALTQTGRPLLLWSIDGDSCSGRSSSVVVVVVVVVVVTETEVRKDAVDPVVVSLDGGAVVRSR